MGGTGRDVGESIRVDQSGNVYTTGSFTGTADFDPEIGFYNLNSVGEGDVFVHKMSPCTNNTSSTINIFSCSSYIFNCQTFSSSGTYTIVLKNSIGCDSIVTLNLTIGNSTVTSTITASACNNYTWNGETFTASGTYFDTLTSTNGCDSIVALQLTINTTSAFTMTASACKNYSWNGQSLTTSGLYTDTLVSANGCDSIVTLRLTISANLYSTNQSICKGQSYEGYTISGTYIDTLVDSNGCDSIRTLILNVMAGPIPDLGPDKDLCAGDSLVLSPGQFSSYQWQDGSVGSNLNVKRPGLYSVLVTDNCGTARDEILVKETACDIRFPSAFTPNNDGKNELFKVLGTLKMGEYHLVVYNRWGQKVFETNDYTRGWDGKINGRSQQSGVYVWHCRLKKLDNPRIITMKGTVMLIK
jgi:gliding motility-associated-like protein